MTSKSVLLDSLDSYNGTIVFVSHDRSFIESLATRVIELAPDPDRPEAPSVVRDFPGDYSYYAWKLEHEGAEPESQQAPGADEQSARADQRTEQERHKARRNRIQQLEREMEGLLEKIDALQTRHREVQLELTDPLVYGVGASVRRLKGELEQIDTEIAELSGRWEAAEHEHTELLDQ
jgi:ATP-binding cassette subfamily F protein 3